MAATVTIASGATWQEVAADRHKHRDATIAAVQPALPEIKYVPQNTIDLAKQYLTPEEIKITETLVEDLVVKLAKAELSSETVTKAFLRRAALAQVAVSSFKLAVQIQTDVSGDQLYHRTSSIQSPRARCIPRCLPERKWEACWSTSWNTH